MVKELILPRVKRLSQLQLKMLRCSNKGVASFSTDNFDVSSGAVTIKDLGITNDELAGSIANSKLSNSSVTITGGSGLSNGGEISLGGSVTLDVNVDNSSIEINNDS